MALTFEIIVVFLVTLQLIQQVSLSNKFYDTKDLDSPLNNQLTFHSRFNVLSSLKFKQSVKHAPQVKSREELNRLNVERGSVSRPRPRRQLDQDADIDAEIISNDPKIFSHGKSMPMTTADDNGEHQHDNSKSSSWNEDLDTTIKNSLGELEETTNEDAESSQSDKQASTFHSRFQDISSANHEPTPKMSDEDSWSESSSNAPQPSISEIHVVPTVHYEDLVSKESDSEPVESKLSSLTTDSEQHGNSPIEDNNNDKESEEIVNEDHSTIKSPELDVSVSNIESDKNNKEADTFPNVEDNSEVEPQNNEMEKDEPVNAKEETHSSEGTALHEGMPAGQHNKEPEDIISKEMDIDEGEGGDLDKGDDVDVFMDLPVSDSGSKSSSGQLNLLEEESTIDSEEGSGDIESDPTGSHETTNMHENTVSNSTTDKIPSEEISSPTDNTNLNIDSDTDKTYDDGDIEYEDTDEDENAKEIESPIVDPTALKEVDPPETVKTPEADEDEETDEELDTTEPTDSKSNDSSLTYDRNAIINPFNIDNASEISRNFGKAIGIIDSSEETAEGEEFEGSGASIFVDNTDTEKGSLENDSMFKSDPNLLDRVTQTEDYSDTTTAREEKEVAEVPVVVRYDMGSLSAAGAPVNEDDEIEKGATTESGVIAGEKETTELPGDVTPNMVAEILPVPGHPVVGTAENGSVLPLPAGINEMGINKGGQIVSPEKEEDETSSSSTGSFIVLGAIMATIVALLGYSVIKSYRQKQENSRKPPEDDMGTELKEVDTLLPVSGRNGHGPANRLNVESDRLLGPSAENDNNDMKPDGRYPIYQNGVHGNDDKPTNALQIEDPNDLSEVKVNSHQTPVPDDPITPQTVNGLMSSPGDQPKSPSADDRESWGYGTKPESAKIKMFIDHDSIPKTPIVIVKRGPANVEM